MATRPGRFAGGDDIDLIVRRLGFWSPYPGITDEVIRSIAPREFPWANWMGYTKDADSLLQKYWRMVTRGMDSVWWWRWEKMVAAADKKIGVALDPGVVVAEGSAALEMYGTPTLILHKVGNTTTPVTMDHFGYFSRHFFV